MCIKTPALVRFLRALAILRTSCTHQLKNSIHLYNLSFYKSIFSPPITVILPTLLFIKNLSSFIWIHPYLLSRLKPPRLNSEKSETSSMMKTRNRKINKVLKELSPKNFEDNYFYAFVFLIYCIC